MLKLKRLKIDQFRNVAPGTELHFRDSFNVLLGKNGTGKTTLLNLIVSLLSWNFEPLLGEPLAIEYELEMPGGRVTVRLRNELTKEAPSLSVKTRVKVDELLKLTFSGHGERFEASGEIILSGLGLPQDQVIAFKGSKVSVSKADGSLMERETRSPVAGEGTLWNIWISLRRLLELTDASERPDLMIAMDEVILFGLSTLRRFDESLGYLNHIIRAERAFSAAHPTEVSGYLAHSVDGGPEAVVQEIERNLEETPDADEIRVQADDSGAGFLDKVVRLLGFTSAKIRLQRIARETEPYERIDFANLRFDFTRRDRSIINHTLLSYGQKRLLSFYYYLACSSDCVVADELVNGMHHEWIEACLEDLGARQAFLTSQNPLLLDYLGFESAEEVRSSFVLCRSEQQGDREHLRWENMTAEDAEGFFSAYQVGIQHVSEILRTRGLW